MIKEALFPLLLLVAGGSCYGMLAAEDDTPPVEASVVGQAQARKSPIIAPYKDFVRCLDNMGQHAEKKDRLAARQCAQSLLSNGLIDVSRSLLGKPLLHSCKDPILLICMLCHPTAVTIPVEVHSNFAEFIGFDVWMLKVVSKVIVFAASQISPDEIKAPEGIDCGEEPLDFTHLKEVILTYWKDLEGLEASAQKALKFLLPLDTTDDDC